VANSSPSIATPGRSAPEPLLSIVIVNYNSWREVDRLVAALAAAPEVGRDECEVIVVDNASSGPVPPGLAVPPSGVHLVLRPDNGGFAVGVNAGWRMARGRWLLLLNPDVVADAGLPRRVLGRIERYEAHPDGPPGIVGFGLRDPGGRRQPSVGIDPNLFRSLAGLFIPRRRRKYQSGSHASARPAPWVTGACTLVSADVLHALDGLDEEFFLYYEEVALCRAARRLGWKVEFDPSIEVIHLNPLQNRRITPALRVVTRHSKLLYFLKHLPRWQFVALARIVEAEAAIRGPWERLGGKRADAHASRAIGAIARRMRQGRKITGHEVRDLAASLPGANEEAGFRPRRGAAIGGLRAARET
jgi:GT2 family glycosyltransferase